MNVRCAQIFSAAGKNRTGEHERLRSVAWNNITTGSSDWMSALAPLSVFFPETAACGWSDVPGRPLLAPGISRVPVPLPQFMR